MTRVKHGEDAMINHNRTDFRFVRWGRLVAVAFACALLIAGGAPSAGAAAAGGQVFASPELAADALAAAWHSGRSAEVLKIFGPAGDKLVRSGDPVAEKLAREKLAAAYDKQHRIDSESSSKAVLVLGDDAWPYPIPLVKRGAGWQFDVKAGAEEILNRRIGRNELNAIKVCHAYVEAQHDYAAKERQVSGLHEYAQKVASSEGKHDGLYWRAAAGEEESPLGQLVADAEAQGYGKASAEGRAPFHGYYYRILTKQGEQVPGGVRDYIVDGHMTGGFALVAYPARYGDSGVMTFVVNQEGIIYEKNLGPDTKTIAGRITVYHPDNSWKIVAP
jgi:hypothetical protein